MDPRFRRNHQLHLLLKRRTYVSDHELYEMMRSKQVYRAQNELRRELERRLQEIKIDQKVKVASFMVQKATFIKMVTAREKSRRHLLNVKKYISETFAKDEHFVVENVRDGCEETDNENEFRVHVYDDYTATDDMLHYNDLQDSQNAYYVIQSVNKDWMEDISKKSSGKGRSKYKEKNSDSSKANLDNNASKAKEINENTYLKGGFQRDRSSSFRSLGRVSNKIPVRETPEKRKISPAHEKYKMEINANKPDEHGIHDHEESLVIKDTDHQGVTGQHENVPVTLPHITIDSKGCQHRDCDSIPNVSTRPPQLSNQRLLQPLPPIATNCQPSTYLDVPKAAPLPPLLHPHERERSVTMLFVEESDSDEEEFLNQISSFDIDAFSKHHRRKRGYSIVISSTDLHQNDDGENDNEDEDIKKKDKKKNRITAKYPHHPSSWGVKILNVSPRERSNQWYQHFMKSKKCRNKPRQKPQGLDHKDDRPPDYQQCQKMNEFSSTLKTPIHSDSQISPELLCQLKLQRLKLHCQSLSQRVALFVSS